MSTQGGKTPSQEEIRQLLKKKGPKSVIHTGGCHGGPCNDDYVSQQEMLRLFKHFGVKTFIETGTYRGHTTNFVAPHMQKVITIEANRFVFLQTRQLLMKRHNNIVALLGNSGQALGEVLDHKDRFNITEPVLFYLDAHWNNYWPLQDEMRAIAKVFANNCIIVVDDFQVPNRPELKYDSYNGVPNNYDFIAEQVREVYPEGAIYYYTDHTKMHTRSEHIGPRGKIYLFPKSWRDRVLPLIHTENGENYSNLSI